MIRSVIALLSLVTLLASGRAHAVSPADDTAGQLQAIGIATLNWVSDQTTAAAANRGQGVSAATCLARTTVDLAAIPIIAHGDLEALLVPTYLASLPTADAFGQPLEFRLASDLSAAQIVSVRSPGADGTFDGTVYAGQLTTGPDDDQVWADGFFYRLRPLRDPIALQQRATGEMFAFGLAAMNWLTDQISDPATAATRHGRGLAYDLTVLDPVTHAGMVSRLIPNYTQCVPEFDPWGRAYDYFLNDDLLAGQVVAVRTAGGDGTVEGDVYTVGGFPADDLARDLVWADGFFVQFPDGPRSQVFEDGFETGDLWGTWSCVEE